MTFEIVGDAGYGVGMGEKIDGPVVVTILAVSKNAAGHKLRISDGTGKRSRRFGGVNAFLFGIY
jgi:hypothetical protein